METTISIVQRVGATGSEVSLIILGLVNMRVHDSAFVKGIETLSMTHKEVIEALMQMFCKPQERFFQQPFETSVRWGTTSGRLALMACRLNFVDGNYVSGSNTTSI